MNDLNILKKIEKLIGKELREKQESTSPYNTYQVDSSGTAIIRLDLYLDSTTKLKSLIMLLSNLKQLKSLTIEDSGIDDISFFTSLTQIQELDLDGNLITDITPLKKLKQLTSLCLCNNQIRDISPLKELSALQQLNLTNTAITDISSLTLLTKLNYLHLSFNNIRTVRPLKKLRLLRVLSLSSNKLKTITALSSLKNLIELDLSGNEISDLSALHKLQKLEELNLCKNRFTNLSSLADLTELKFLDLSFNDIEDLSPLQNLIKLEKLHLSENPLISLFPLKELKHLTTLSLEKCQLTDLSPLASLTQLQHLDLSSNQISDLTALASLTKLNILNLRENQIHDISPLKELRELTSLNLSQNPIKDILDLRTLPQLNELSINNCGLDTIQPLQYVSQLNQISIKNNQISDLSPLRYCPNLYCLRASKNKISDLSPLANLTEITDLSLDNNYIQDISPLENCRHLVIARLRYNQLHSLPAWTSRFDIEWDSDKEPFYYSTLTLCITGNPLTDPPLEIIKQGSEAVQRYFERRKKEAFSAIHEAKLILVGDGAAGKTSLQKRLVDKDASLPEEDTRTRGIQICNWEFKPNYIAHIWDFGGQDVYYPVHRFFLTENSVFVLLASTRNEQHNFDYWIPTLYQFGGHSPIIIGQTCHGGNHIAWNDLGLYISDPHFNIIRASEELPYFELDLPHENTGLPAIKKEIIHQLQKLPHCNKDIPTSWITVREALKKEGDTKPCINYDRFIEICDEMVPESFAQTADYQDCASFLHNIGALLWYSQNNILKNWIILHPEWGMKAVYKIIDDDDIQRRRGQIIADDFNRLWKDKMYIHKHFILKQMLAVFRVAFPKRHKTDEYIIPARLLSMPEEKRWKQENGLWLEYVYPFMPRGILNQLSAELSRYIILDKEQEEEVWNNAVNLTAGEAYGQVVEIFYQKKIIIRTKGKDARGLAMVIMDALNTITQSYKGVIPQIHVPCTCDECRQGENRTLFKYDDLQRWSQKGRKELHCNESGQTIRIDDLLYNAGFLQPLKIAQHDSLWNIQKIHIFLASSSELKVDRKEFELFINRENKLLLDKGVFLYLDIWEDFIDAMSPTRLQDEYNKAVIRCDIFVSLFFTKAGIFTEEEFDTAYGQFIRKGKPYVYTYFKNAPINTGELNKKDLDSLLQFKEKLQELGHFPTAYKTIDDLKSQFKRQLDKLIVRLKREVPRGKPEDL